MSLEAGGGFALWSPDDSFDSGSFISSTGGDGPAGVSGAGFLMGLRMASRAGGQVGLPGQVCPLEFARVRRIGPLKIREFQGRGICSLRHAS